MGRREGLTAGEIDWEVSATEKDGCDQMINVPKSVCHSKRQLHLVICRLHACVGNPVADCGKNGVLVPLDLAL